MDFFFLASLVMVFGVGLLVGAGWTVCEEDEDEWDDEATFTTSYPRRDR